MGRARIGGVPRPTRVLLALLLPVLSVRLAAADEAADEARRKKVEEAKRLIAADEEAFRTRVNVAIDRGVEWLKGKQRSNGSYPAYGDRLPKDKYDPMDLGVNALVLLTLAKSGVPANDEKLDRLLGWCKADYANMKGRKKVMVYTASVLVLALDALYAPREQPPAAAGPQKPGGRYVEPTAPKPPSKSPCKLPAQAASLTKELVEHIRRAQHASGGWRYPGNPMAAPEGDADMSNTQYALLALNTAARCGIDVPVEVYTKALDYLLREQEPDGIPSDVWVQDAAWEPGLEVPRFRVAGKAKARGWTYLPGHKEPSTGSMTVGAVASLAIVKERLLDAKKLTPEIAKRIDRGIVDGLAWTADAFTVEDNPVVPAAPAMWHYYYLYGLERMGSLLGLEFVGKSPWYRLGADHLVGGQSKDGGWRILPGSRPTDHTESEVVQTCFALLFLHRSTVPPVVPVAPPVVLTGGS
jgi:hypothetical protein